MSAPRYIRHKGIMYRLAADAPGTTVQETAQNPVAAPAAPATDPILTPGATAPESENPPTLTPSPADEDLKLLEGLIGSVTSVATSLATGLAPLLEKVKAKARPDADAILASTKANIDSLVENFRALSAKYAGYARRSMQESEPAAKETK